MAAIVVSNPVMLIAETIKLVPLLMQCIERRLEQRAVGLRLVQHLIELVGKPGVLGRER